MTIECDRLDANIMLQTDVVQLNTQPSVWMPLTIGEMIVIVSFESNIPSGQEWFWTPQWQAGEREASRELKEGRGFGPFESIAEMKACFEAWKEVQKTTKASS